MSFPAQRPPPSSRVLRLPSSLHAALFHLLSPIQISLTPLSLPLPCRLLYRLLSDPPNLRQLIVSQRADLSQNLTLPLALLLSQVQPDCSRDHSDWKWLVPFRGQDGILEEVSPRQRYGKTATEIPRKRTQADMLERSVCKGEVAESRRGSRWQKRWRCI